MTREDSKRRVAEAALDYVELEDVVGVGTGTTANFFIDALARIRGKMGPSRARKGPRNV
jgi:ribose 5-phosphate isomerase A